MYSIPMALVDYVPVFMFLFSAMMLGHDFFYKFTKWQYSFFAAGGTMVFVAGFYKATYKLLYAANVCDFERLNQMFFPLQATGFLLIGFASIAYILIGSKSTAKTETHLYSAAAAPVFFSGTMIFVVGMVLGVFALSGSMAVLAKRLKKPFAVLLYILSAFFMLGMGYLSSKDFTQAYMNWAAQIINILGQATFMWATIILRKNGLREYEAGRR